MPFSIERYPMDCFFDERTIKYQVAEYIRLSKEDENEGPSQSVTNQKSLLDAFVTKHHLSVYDTYIDDGWSGTTFDRPGFQRMIRDIEAKKVNMVITKDLSRLGRDYIMTGHYMERYFPEKRVRYISLLDGIDTGVESTANDITPFRAIMNDMYAKDISKKIKSVKRDKQRKGLFIGGKPMFGYKMHPTEKNKIVIDEEAASVVRKIFAMAREGVSCRKIAVWLNDEHIPSPAAYCGWNMGRVGPYAGLWSSERISEMLRCETYLGNMVQGRTVKISYKSDKCLKQNRENWIVVEGTHEPIIDRETYDTVQRQLASRRHTRSRTYDFPLKGIAVCHECGYPLATINRPNAAGEDVLYFVCRTYQRFTKAGVCTCHAIKVQTVMETVVAKIRETCWMYLLEEELLPPAEEVLQSSRAEQEQEKEVQRLKSKIETLGSNLECMYMDRLSGLLDGADFERIYKRTKEERQDLEAKLRDLEKPSATPQARSEHAKALVWEVLDTVETNRELLVNLVERVELTEEKQVMIKFRFCQLDEIAS